MYHWLPPIVSTIEWYNNNLGAILRNNTDTKIHVLHVEVKSTQGRGVTNY